MIAARETIPTMVPAMMPPPLTIGSALSHIQTEPSTSAPAHRKYALCHGHGAGSGAVSTALSSGSMDQTDNSPPARCSECRPIGNIPNRTKGACCQTHSSDSGGTVAIAQRLKLGNGFYPLNRLDGIVLALLKKESRMRDPGARQDRSRTWENRLPVRFKRINTLTKPKPGQDQHQRKNHTERPV